MKGPFLRAPEKTLHGRGQFQPLLRPLEKPPPNVQNAGYREHLKSTKTENFAETHFLTLQGERWPREAQ